MIDAKDVRWILFQIGLIPRADVESWELDHAIGSAVIGDGPVGSHAAYAVAWAFSCEWDCGLRDWFDNFG